MRLSRVSVPADPPVRALTHEASAVVRVSFSATTSGNSTISPKPNGASTGTINKSIGINLDEVRKLINSEMGYTADSSFEINIRKVCVWGPLPPSEDVPTLAVDLSDISGGLAVTDRCGANHRARMGITSPFNLWIKPNVERIIHISTTATSGLAAIMDLSVSWRRFKISE